jgi:hypothetical protein
MKKALFLGFSVKMNPPLAWYKKHTETCEGHAKNPRRDTTD